MQTCVQYSGNSDGLRRFLAEKHVPLAKPEATENFPKMNQADAVYDASNAYGRLALVSHENGACTVFSDTANGDQAVSFVEGFLQSSNITFRYTETGLIRVPPTFGIGCTMRNLVIGNGCSY